MKMSKFELMKANQNMYHQVYAEQENMSDGLEKDVKRYLILPWIKGTNWLGGLSDRIANREIEKLMLMGYDCDDIMNEFDRQVAFYTNC